MNTLVKCLYCKSNLVYKNITIQFTEAYNFSCRCVMVGSNNGFSKTLDRNGSTLNISIYWQDVNLYFYRQYSSKKVLANATVINVYNGRYLPNSNEWPEVTVQCPKDIDLFTIETARQFVDTMLLMA